MIKHKDSILCKSIITLAVIFIINGCDKKDTPAENASPHVNVITLKAQDLLVTTELPGRTSAFREAEVRPQVGGILLARHFVEGSDVKAGDSLYQIDPAPYMASYTQAKGDMVKAVAAANIAHLTAARYSQLLKTHYISQQDYDKASASAQQADADVVAAQATVKTAKINLAYTEMISPISGLIGKSSVTEGALVTTNQTSALATVQQLDPIYVDVTQSSNDFLRLKSEITQGQLQRQAPNAEVTLLLDNGKVYPLKGQLAFSDVTVDESTNSITVRVIFPNPEHNLLPGMFVRARIEEGVQKNAILVPQQGVTRDPRGSATVMLVGRDNKIVTKTVNAMQAIGDHWLVSSGLQEGDRVVVEGLQKIKPGMTVVAQDVAPNK